MSALSRTKGQSGEREVAALIRALTGWAVRRKVRQHGGDSDLEGVPGWSVEVKRHGSATRSDVAAWWRQAVKQAGDQLPVLFYRLDRDQWRAVWPLAAVLVQPCTDIWPGYEWTAETTVEGWASVAVGMNDQTQLLGFVGTGERWQNLKKPDIAAHGVGHAAHGEAA